MTPHAFSCLFIWSLDVCNTYFPYSRCRPAHLSQSNTWATPLDLLSCSCFILCVSNCLCICDIAPRPDVSVFSLFFRLVFHPISVLLPIHVTPSTLHPRPSTFYPIPSFSLSLTVRLGITQLMRRNCKRTAYFNDLRFEGSLYDSLAQVSQIRDIDKLPKTVYLCRYRRR
ncbi:hypothetical protein BDM02DRAFT_894903 [Thelephora ganbajun]|uniref:Uncharacterized protein n=1 Tax=Thelephora ganbajun TaxID=370292 RepID=A0ACB6Z4T7_THEGA|nr:hypothetical protein BDM02DRAFT_894903 [Thelephora ganbajun]